MKKPVKKPVAKKAVKKVSKPAAKPKKAPAKKPAKKAVKKAAKKPALKIAPFPEAQLFDQTSTIPKSVSVTPAPVAAPVSTYPQFAPVRITSTAVTTPSSVSTTISELVAREKHSGNIASATLPTWQP
jgi:hypothetical protein